MQMDVNENNIIRLKEVFIPIELISTGGESITICMRDGGFEIAIENAVTKTPDILWYKICNGTFEQITNGPIEKVV